MNINIAGDTLQLSCFCSLRNRVRIRRNVTFFPPGPQGLVDKHSPFFPRNPKSIHKYLLIGMEGLRNISIHGREVLGFSRGIFFYTVHYI